MGQFVLSMNKSTQSLSGRVFDADSGQTVWTGSINYGKDLRQFRMRYGFRTKGSRAWTSARMLAAANDAFFAKLAAEFPRVSEIEIVTAASMQHGLEALTDQAYNKLKALSPLRPLDEQLDGVFVTDEVPIWRDHRSSPQCRRLASSLGGPQQVTKLTGSPPVERFTGNQIAWYAQYREALYARTAYLGPISFADGCLLIGGIAPIDFANAAGMNLMDISALVWASAAVKATAPDLLRRLPRLVASTAVIGFLSPYYRKFGLKEDVKVLVVSGDNPDAFLGIGIATPGKYFYKSGGSSDVLATLARDALADPSGYGNIFCTVTGTDQRMKLIVTSNASILRDQQRKRLGLDWDGFSECLRKTPAGNNGKALIYFPAPEITPGTTKPVERYFGGLTPSDCNAYIRALVEAQALNINHFATNWMGALPPIGRVTGGASVNRAIVQTWADVYGRPMQIMGEPDAVSLGGAWRAASVLTGTPMAQYAEAAKLLETIDPALLAAHAYDEMKRLYPGRLNQALAGQ